ncbi:GGDEF domain-containing protein [Aureimonas jatrophae]|uniref:diguanylate cyclase n=1 Tax=Aureimonas jatrophae TaxID=1166073 RepID=A0A1H0HMX2_9HYPH|nr:GGDEF domain-containing protein [Aureimonas jatrophae]MBB3950663.1 diguanylate cyclase (GGDEF)-like protein [Aureimonas jatrophae]SDO20181.1 diguanylate cyclase (GGDEF) domain-containing protein [Aureimonas jatrophae]
MSGEVPILYFLIVGTAMVAGALTLWERHATTTHRAPLAWWATGYFMIAAGCILRIVPNVPHEIVIGLSNVLVTWGYGAVIAGQYRFLGRALPLVLPVGLLIATILWVAFGQYQSMNDRIVMTSLASGSICWIGCAILARSWREADTALRAQRLASVLMAIHAGFFFVRAGSTLFSSDAVARWGPDVTITMFEGILWSFAGPATLLTMVREQRENRHEAASSTDFLTGLDNRRAFFGKGEAIVSGDQAGALLVFDLDHFKRINDTFGHGIGDEMLQLFSRIAQREMRGVDVLARLGGEEFAALLPGLDASEAEAVARRVARSLEATALDRPGAAPVRATVSVGVAMFDPREPAVLAAILAAADRALYRAKREGRNRIERAVPLAA